MSCGGTFNPGINIIDCDAVGAIAREHGIPRAGLLRDTGASLSPCNAWLFLQSLEIFSLLANVADATSLVIHPASTTHQQRTADEQRAAGFGPETIVIGRDRALRQDIRALRLLMLNLMPLKHATEVHLLRQLA